MRFRLQLHTLLLNLLLRPVPERPSGGEPPSKRARTVHLVKKAASTEVRLKDMTPALLEGFRLADDAEWRSFLEFDAVEVIPDAEASLLRRTLSPDLILPSRVVRVDKHRGRTNDDGTPMAPKLKSRIVIQGFADTDYTQRADAPTLSALASHVLFSRAAGYGLRLVSADISSAFLNGRALDRELYTSMPKDILLPELRGKLCRLKKGIYGLRQAPRLWFERLRDEIVSLGFRQLKLEPTLYVLDDPQCPDRPHAILGTHVDDLLACCSPTGLEILQRLSKPFVIKEWNFDDFTYCGRRIRQLPSGEVTVDMSEYGRKLDTLSFPAHRMRDPSLKLTEPELKLFRGLLGSLSWLSTQGRPDLSFSVSRLQAYNKDATIAQVQEVNAVVRQAKKREVILRFPPLDLSRISFAAVSDASFASMREGRSQSGSMILLCDQDLSSGNTGHFHLLVWKSSRQKRACRSTVGAEMLACADTIDMGDLVRGLWAELRGEVDLRGSLERAPEMHWVIQIGLGVDHFARIPKPWL